jgi:putative ATP-dependent endonuclease of OLD family
MRLSEITLTNFRCFGPIPTTIELSDLTAFVGTNACGKTAILHALQRLFGVTAADRELKPEDFHVPRPADPPDPTLVTERTLSIEVKLDFPELEDRDADEDAVAECFRHMVVTEAGGMPYCRVRLEGVWSNSSLPEGEVEQHTYWITAAANGEGEETKQEMRAVDRSRVHLHYIPAARDPVKQIRQVSGSIMARLFKAVNWSDAVKANVATASNDIQTAFGGEAGVDSIQKALSNNWQTLHDAVAYSGVKIRPISNRFEDILRQVEAVFSPSPGGAEDPLERLSDGQRSLFYLAMVGAAFDIEEEVLAADEGDEAFDPDRLDPPSLTIFAVEEPENHISPHFLGRIMDVLRKLAESPRAQVLLTSHSPSIMHRVEPTEVRHLRLDPNSRTTLVNTIELPPDEDEAHKFVREAVRAFPELYFARLVVLGEGDSEEIVIPRVAEAESLPIDQSFVSIVPLGGRHVNHFWRLLSSLDVPYVTLLDLDRERDGGGWGRIKYALKQLIAVGVPREGLLTVKNERGGTKILSDKELANMHKRDSTFSAQMAVWCKRLEEHDVFFSQPLDLDFLMLTHLPDAYRALEDGDRGPAIPEDGDENFDTEREAVIQAVLKDAGGDGSTYTHEEIMEFFWYRYLFLGRGKPTTHLRALSNVEAEELKEKCPEVLQRLVARINDVLTPPPGADPDAE